MFHAPFSDLLEANPLSKGLKGSTKKFKLLNQIKANNQLMRNNGDLSHLGDPALTTHYLASQGNTTAYGSTGFGKTL